MLCAGPPQIRVPPRFQDTAVFEKGEEVVIKIPFTGFPKPSVKWLRGDNELKTGDKYKVDVGERHAILTIRNSDRMDDGPYRLELENDLGTDSAIIKIAINGIRRIHRGARRAVLGPVAPSSVNCNFNHQLAYFADHSDTTHVRHQPTAVA